MEDLDIMPTIEVDKAEQAPEVESVSALEPQARHVRRNQIFQWPILAGRTQIRRVSFAREAVDEIDGHALGATDIEGINQVHDTDTAHARTSSGRGSIGSADDRSGTSQCWESRARKA